MSELDQTDTREIVTGVQSAGHFLASEEVEIFRDKIQKGEAVDSNATLMAYQRRMDTLRSENGGEDVDKERNKAQERSPTPPTPTPREQRARNRGDKRSRLLVFPNCASNDAAQDSTSPVWPTLDLLEEEACMTGSSAGYTPIKPVSPGHYKNWHITPPREETRDATRQSTSDPGDSSASSSGLGSAHDLGKDLSPLRQELAASRRRVQGVPAPLFARRLMPSYLAESSKDALTPTSVYDDTPSLDVRTLTRRLQALQSYDDSDEPQQGFQPSGESKLRAAELLKYVRGESSDEKDLGQGICSPNPFGPLQQTSEYESHDGAGDRHDGTVQEKGDVMSNEN